MVKNNYGVKKKILLTRNMNNIYFIPIAHQKGNFKLKELNYLKYPVEEFAKFSQRKKQKLFKKYSFWYDYNNKILSNDFNRLYDENEIGIENIEVSYTDTKNCKGKLSKISFPNSKSFFQYIENNEKVLNDIINRLVTDATNSILNYINKEVNGEEISRMFLDYYGDGRVIDVLFVIATKEDYEKVKIYYSSNEYEKKFGKNTEEELEKISMNSGEYSRKFTVENIEEINSYYCSLLEQGIEIKVETKTNIYTDNTNNFLYTIEMLIKKELSKNLEKLNLASNFEFLDPLEYD